MSDYSISGGDRYKYLTTFCTCFCYALQHRRQRRNTIVRAGGYLGVLWTGEPDFRGVGEDFGGFAVARVFTDTAVDDRVGNAEEFDAVGGEGAVDSELAATVVVNPGWVLGVSCGWGGTGVDGALCTSCGWGGDVDAVELGDTRGNEDVAAVSDDAQGGDVVNSGVEGPGSSWIDDVRRNVYVTFYDDVFLVTGSDGSNDGGGDFVAAIRTTGSGRSEVAVSSSLSNDIVIVRDTWPAGTEG